jgi:rRNA maturation endonuclease Nob1
MPKLLYDCPCGKKHKTRMTVYTHKKKMVLESKDETDKKNILNEISLKGEFENMSQKIIPKDDKKDEYKYECGKCHKEFNNFSEGKTCPFCGVEF